VCLGCPCARSHVAPRDARATARSGLPRPRGVRWVSNAVPGVAEDAPMVSRACMHRPRVPLAIACWVLGFWGPGGRALLGRGSLHLGCPLCAAGCWWVCHQGGSHSFQFCIRRERWRVVWGWHGQHLGAGACVCVSSLLGGLARFAPGRVHPPDAGAPESANPTPWHCLSPRVCVCVCARARCRSPAGPHTDTDQAGCQHSLPKQRATGTPTVAILPVALGSAAPPMPRPRPFLLPSFRCATLCG
jgi:hypothetical protein